MKAFNSPTIFLLFTINLLCSCSVDYSILDERFCNSQNQCIEGYICDMSIGKCVKSDALSDISSKDIRAIDIHHDTIYYDLDEIPNLDTIEDIVLDIKDYGFLDIIPDSGFCEVGTFICKEKDLYKCDENSEFIFEKNCEIGCKDGHCMDCLPNEKICLDETNIRICDQEGIYQTEKCSYKCYNNQCVICLPTDKYCNGKKAIKCNPIGTQWEETDCEIGCTGGECMVCEPNTTKICIDNYIATCNSNGTDFEKTKNCCHDNNCLQGECAITAPRVIDYNPKDWKVGSTINWNIQGCFFVANASKVMIDFDRSWKEITEYNNFKYLIRQEDLIQIEVTVLTGTEFNFIVVNPDGQSTPSYKIKKH